MKLDKLTTNPSALLLVTGTLIGLNFPLGKIAAAAGVSPMLWSMVVSLGAATFLLPFLVVTRRLRLPRRHLARYAIISGLITFVLATLLVFTVIPHVGAGYTGLMFALSPVFTLALAGIARLKTPGLRGTTGIIVGLVGAAVVTLTRQAGSDVIPIPWLLVALLIPFTLACGNIYRTIDWPEGASPDVLAFWSHAFSVLVFVGLMLVTLGGVPFGDLGRVPGATFAQALAAGLTFPAYFRLQQAGGPVLLSQIGYVGAAVGLIAVTVFLGERYSAATWGGAGVIAIGIAITVWAQRTPAVAATR
ncbi:MAG: DMT family transporter [Alphaproteobacteria bacterium]